VSRRAKRAEEGKGGGEWKVSEGEDGKQAARGVEGRVEMGEVEPCDAKCRGEGSEMQAERGGSERRGSAEEGQRLVCGGVAMTGRRSEKPAKAQA